MKRTDDLVSRADIVKEFIKLFGCIQNVSDIYEWADICQTTVHEIPSTKTSTTDLISRQDALKPFCIAPDGTRIPEVDCDNFPVEFSVEFIKKHLLTLPSADAVSRGEYDKLFDNAVSELTKLEKEYDDVIAHLNQKLENSVSREAYEKVLIECGEVKTKLGELQRRTKSVQGEWIKTVDGNGWDDWYVLKCPFCGATIEDKQYRSWEYNFCPHCGERVKGDGRK